MDTIIKIFEKYGLIGLIVGTLFWMAWRRDIWIMAFVKEITQRHIDERKVWLEKEEEKTKTISELTNSIKRHDERAEERGKFVRKEHEQMIQSLGRINGYKY